MHKTHINDCKIYQYYIKVLHLDAVLDVFTDSHITPDMCDKASFYFGYLCSQCKNTRKEVKK